jgi:hypothetical protein
MATHQRVMQIRAEAGIPTLPAPAPAPQPATEPEEVRNARFNELQRVRISDWQLIFLFQSLLRR